MDQLKRALISIKAKITDLDYKSIYSRINPVSPNGADPLVDHLFRVLILLFPLYTGQTKAFLGITGKDILVGILVLIMGLWCFYNALNKGIFDELSGSRKRAFLMVLFLFMVLVFARQMVRLSGEAAHTYRYLGGFILLFCSMYAGSGGRYYLQLLSVSYGLVYLSQFRYIFTMKATILGAERLLSSPKEFIPLLMLGIGAGSILYLTEEKAGFEKLYLVFTGAGLVLFFLYGDMMAFAIMLLFMVGLQLMGDGSLLFLKKCLILVFLYGFCASNAPLITYFGARGISWEFDLEYSIYIDIVIAVAGLFVTTAWDKIDKDNPDKRMVRRFYKWYRGCGIGIFTLLFVAFIFGSRGSELKKGFGGKALEGISTGLMEAVKSSNGEIWHVMGRYGLVGVAVLMALGFLLVYRIILLFRSGMCEEVQKGYLMISLLFASLSLFYPFSSTSTPLYIILVGISVMGGLSDEVVVAAAGEGQEQGETEDDNGLIWLPMSVRGTVSFKSDRNNDDELRKRTQSEKRKRRARLLLGRSAFVAASAMAASVIVLAIVGVYTAVVPDDPADEKKTMVQTAIERREEERLMAAAVEVSGEQISEQKPVEENSGQQTQAASTAGTNKSTGSYNIVWNDDNTSCSIWSSGNLQGTMTISNGDGNTVSMKNYGIHYSGSGNEQKKYLNISVNTGEDAPVVNADQGFVSALKDMGYEGIYLNNNTHSW